MFFLQTFALKTMDETGMSADGADDASLAEVVKGGEEHCDLGVIGDIADDGVKAPSDSDKELPEKIDEIVERQKRNTFPDVLPSNQVLLVQSTCEDMLSWVHEGEAGRIQSYIQEVYVKFRSANVVPEEKESKERALWYQRSFYMLLKEYLDKTRFKVLWDIIVSYGIAEGVSVFQEAEIHALALRYPAISSESFQEYIDELWKVEFEKQPPFMKKAGAQLKRNWLKKGILVFIKEFFEGIGGPGFCFVPALDPDDLKSVFEKKKAEALVQRIQREQVTQVEKKLKAMFEKKTSAMSVSVLNSCRETLYKNFLKSEYWKIMAEVVEASEEESFVFTPAVRVEEIHDETKKHAEDVVGKVLPIHVDLIKRRVEDGLHASLAVYDLDFLVGCEDVVKASWLEEHYFSIVEEVVANCVQEYVFTPDVAIKSLSDEAKQEHAMILCSKVCAHHEDAIKKRCKEQWEEEKKKWGHVDYLGEDEAVVKAAWMEENYFRIVEEELKEKSKCVDLIAPCTKAEVIVSCPKKKTTRYSSLR